MTDDTPPVTENQNQSAATQDTAVHDRTPHPIKLLKTLVNSKALAAVSGNALKLLVAVVTREDELFYSRPVRFFNDELQTITGLGKTALVEARRVAVDHGWLKYTGGTKSVRGVYKTLVPRSAIEAARDTRGSLFDNESKADSRTEKNIPSGMRTENTTFRSPIDPESDAFRSPIGHQLNPKKTPTPLPKEIGWGEIEKRLSKLGLQVAPQTIRNAKQRGYAEQQVANIVSHYESHAGAWRSPGVIHSTITNHPASLAFDDPERWPDFGPEYVTAQKHERRRERDAVEQTQRSQQTARLDDERSELNRLEKLHGKAIDALSPDELAELIAKEPDAKRQESLTGFASNYGRTSSLVRPALLRLMAEAFRLKSEPSTRAGPAEEPTRTPTIRIAKLG